MTSNIFIVIHRVHTLFILVLKSINPYSVCCLSNDFLYDEITGDSKPETLRTVINL